MSAWTIAARMGVASLLATAAVVPGTAGSAGASVATDDSYWVPVDRKITVRGHGYGHGHGMSQHGAQGAALKGRTHEQILGFYYPGTELGRMRGPVRVLITADEDNDVVVSPAKGLKVRDLGNGAVHELPVREGLSRWRLVVRGPQNRAAVSFLTPDGWKRFRAGAAWTLAGDGEFLASGPLRLWKPDGTSTVYRGRLRAASPASGSAQRDTVNVVSMDNYVRGVVPHEMPASWHPAALRAQAVAARTYATWSRNENFNRHYQICDTTWCQVYGGLDAEDSRSNAAVRQTRRRILRYAGKPAFTQFSASNGGWSAAGSVPYLVAQEDPFDGWSGNYVHDWAVTVDAGHFERQYSSLGRLQRIRVVRRDGNGEWGGRVESLVLDGSNADVTISGDSFRWAFGLRSNWFSVDPTPIIRRWAGIGGEQSRLGSVRTAEYAAGAGSAQAFEGGRIYFSPGTGAHELYGPVLRRYRRMGGPGSRLAFPVSPTTAVAEGTWASFQTGALYHKPGRAPIPVFRRIANRYESLGGPTSDLGWPTRTHYRVSRGNRVDFERGHVTFVRETKRVVVTYTG